MSNAHYRPLISPYERVISALHGLYSHERSRLAIEFHHELFSFSIDATFFGRKQSKESQAKWASTSLALVKSRIYEGKIGRMLNAPKWRHTAETERTCVINLRGVDVCAQCA